MNLTYRKAEKWDFNGMYRALFPTFEQDAGMRNIIETEWNVVFANPAMLCMIVEDIEKPIETRIVGCAQTVFVSDGFLRLAKSGISPYAIQRLGEPLPDGSQPMLMLEQVRIANSGEGLNAFTTRWGWADALPDAGDRRRIRDYMDQKYPLFYRGYNFKEILIEATGDWPCKALEMGGYKIRTDYAAYYKAQGEPPAPDKHAYLMGLTRQEAHRDEGSYASRVFVYTPPVFHFKPNEQELLELALQSLSDDEIALRLSLSKDAVKKRWAALYEWVSAKMPALLPVNDGEGRGPEKRRLLLNYLREHPEELRPILPRR